MRELRDHRFPLAAIDDITHQESRSLGAIVGDFYINHRHYLVIHPSTKLKSHINKNQTTDVIGFSSRVGWFEANQQLYLIIEADELSKLNELTKQKESSKTQPNFDELLTNRERQIVQLVALGQPNKRIAKQLQISEWTVSTHLRRIFAKLGVDSRAAMVYQCASLLETESS
jgi:DNA-binding CsgD family transcriptional regulator